MTEYHKFQSDDGKYFGLSWQETVFSNYDSDGGDLGRGSGQHVVRFFSEEGREYYIQKMEMEKRMKSALWELRSLQSAVKACFTKTGRVRRKKLAAMAASLGVGK